MSDAPLNIAYYVTGHGLGHATRVVEVCRQLVASGHKVFVVTAAAAGVFIREIPSQQLSVRRAVLDCGSKQQDAFSVDMKGSLELYQETAVDCRDAILTEEVRWLKTSEIDLVAVDIVPIAFAAAAAAGLPAVGVSNFSWDLIYSEYASTLGNVGNSYRKMVWQIAEDYACASVLLRLPGYSPMPAFGEVIDVPLVVRHAQKSKAQVYIELRLQEDTHLCVFIYGGQPPGEWELREENLPEGWICVVCSGGKPIVSDNKLPSNFRLAKPDDFIPDLVRLTQTQVNAANCVLGKIGYGTTSECLGHGTPFIFIRRDYFNEEPFLRKQLEVHGLGVEMKRRDFLSGNWAPFLLKTLTMESNFNEATNGAEVVARMLEHIARHKGYIPIPEPPEGDVGTANGYNANGPPRGRAVARAGAGRLRDAIVFGYMMQRHRARGKVEVPEWYVPGAVRATSPETPQVSAAVQASTAATQEVLAAFDITHGKENLDQCPDTAAFLSMLHHLDDPVDEDADPPELPERLAAKSLFRWEDEVIVTRAPGRLDVMGGIGDYSGCLVLQKPTAEACHVACQRHPLAKQKVWKHIQNRHKGHRPKPVLRVVSFHADDTNRSPTFDMDLTELLRDGQPISYSEARTYFKSDPATSWAAYVAGPLVVLMHELGLRYPQGISLLLSSAVPEGKGVSSSAAVEVAVMQALCAAHDVHIDGRHLALLCQKVENYVVGAPCGVMDQMASSLGDQQALMAMSCVRHSIGGADYTSVRAGAFMGLRVMTQQKAAEGPEPLGNGYLCSIRPSVYAQHYEENLPESMTGADFLAKYHHHYDHATQISEDRTYAVRQPTAHAINENHRVRCFRQMLLGPLESPEQLMNLGDLMYQSHAGYSRCGLGSDGTDRLVALVRQEQTMARLHQEAPVLYGAKITGGGSGGSVCILGAATAEAEAAVQRIISKYAEETGFNPYEFRGTSIGASRFGHIRIMRR
ncbi:MAG: Arabinose kinase isoform 1 [Trebouxia sp. A1-2]|nr:MAG: Arabinose kinase isoform 1 [Trebouxia sp. A1-2]